MSHDYDIDPLDRAIHETVVGYVNPVNKRRGGKELAAVIGMPTSTLLNKANPNEQYAHLNVRELRQVMLASGDHRVLHVLAAEVGEACVPLPTLEFPADSDLLMAWAEWQAEVAQTVAAAKESLEDKVITIDEVNRIRQELIEDFEKGLAMLDVFKGMAEPDGKVVKIGGRS